MLKPTIPSPQEYFWTWKSCNYFGGRNSDLGWDWIPTVAVAKAAIFYRIPLIANPMYPSKIHDSFAHQIPLYSTGLIWYSTSILGSWNSHWSIIHLPKKLIFSYTYSHVEIPRHFRIQRPFKGAPGPPVARPTSHCSAARCRCWGSSAASRRTSRRAAYAMRCPPTCRCPCRWIPCKTSKWCGWVE